MKNRSPFLLNVVLPVCVTVLSLFISLAIDKVSVFESVLLSLLLGAITSLVSISSSMDQTRKLYQSLDENLKDVEEFLNIKNKIEQINHPYFQKWAQGKLRELLEQNREFFMGTNRTNPHAVDTFGIEGLSYTKKNGSIRAVSSVLDYWEDSFAKEYLAEQGRLIKSKKVTIQRIFIVPREKEQILLAQMNEQASIGIQVGYFYSDDAFMSPEVMKEDFLIQDDSLLVQLFCESHVYDKSSGASDELITLDSRKVKEKLELFNRMWERAAKIVVS